VKAIVVQTFYIPGANKLYKHGEEIDVDRDFAQQYVSCLKIIEEKAAPAPFNKMVTREKEITKTADPMKTATKRGRKKNGVRPNN